MNRIQMAVLAIGMAWGTADGGERRISLREYRDRMEAGWLGQMIGVAWAAPTEFKWKDQIIPSDQVPSWRPEIVNQAFHQDDLYVEMTFLATLERCGLMPPIREAGIDFANSEYRLWCANQAGRENLRKGIAPPDSGHPQFNRCPNDIDYQIEADYSGLIAPGLPQAAVDLGEVFGRLMNYGDGVNAGQFVGAMYAEAFFERDVRRIVQRALRAIPAQSHYAEMVRDMLTWHAEEPSNWEATWARCQKKWREDPEYQKGSNGGIDCRINGAYVLMGLLYGGGRLEDTIVISMRCGQDSDCNPSSAAGVLMTALGLSAFPPGWREAVERSRKFSFTAYDFDGLLNACESLARQFVGKYGGRIEPAADGGEVWVIPDVPPRPSPLRRSWEPEPPLNVRFTPEEMKRITQIPETDPVAQARRLFPGWEVRNCGTDMQPGLRYKWGGKDKVLVTHPLNRTTACSLHRQVAVPPQGGRLILEVANDPKGDFELRVDIAGEEVRRELIASDGKVAWRTIEVDLARWAGREVEIELANQPNGWASEAAYWAAIRIEPAQ